MKRLLALVFCLTFILSLGEPAQAAGNTGKETYGIVIGSPNVNIRKIPDARGEKVETVDQGEVIPVFETGKEESISGKKGRWLRISHHGYEGWVFGGYVIGPLPGGAQDPICKPTDGSNPRLVSQQGIGPVQIGMTLDQVAKTWPGVSFHRTSDGDGLALVEIRAPLERVMIAFSDEEDVNAPVARNRKIIFLETFDPLMATAEGVHPGSPVEEVEKVYGRRQRVTLSEIESRQFIEFANQPSWLTLRLDYTGIFEEGQRKTTQVEANAKIFSMAVIHRQ